jgi:hypothetical protein
MEKAWHQANSCEVLSREGQPGTAPMKMLFSGYRASLKTKAAETLAQLATLEDAEKVCFLFFCDFLVLVALRDVGRLPEVGSGFV